MNSNLSQQNPSAPSRHVTLNIITDKVSRFVSVTATHRIPHDNEISRADWHCILKRTGTVVHVVGRGDELTKETLQGLARSYVDGGSSMWVHVDLSALSGHGGPVFTPIDESDKPVNFSDPVWNQLRKMSEGIEL